MSIQIRLPKTKFLVACLLLFSLFFLHQSCTKTNTDAPGKLVLTDAEATQKFFTLPANAPAAVKRTAEKMRQTNAASEFVKTFIKNNGYPAWDKAIIQSRRRVTSASFAGSAASAEGGDTVVIIPVVQVDLAFVDGFVTATLNGSVNLDLYRGGDYSAYSFNNVPADSISADKAAMQVMYFNYRVFGYTRFEVSDNRLLSNDAVLDTSKPHRVFEISSVQEPPQTLTGNESNLLLAIAMCVDIYQSIPCIGIFTDLRIGCSVYIGQSCYTIYVDTGGGGGGSTGPTGGSGPGGGTGGGGTGGTFPCASSQGRTIQVANPCGPANPPPVNPIPPPKLPCERVSTLFQFLNVRARYQDIRDFASGDAEMGYAFNDQGSGIPSIGIANEGRVNINLVANCISYVHCHNSGADYYMFSYSDLEEIFNNIDQGLINEQVVVGIVAPDGTTYLLTIQDRSAFLQAFGNMMINQPNSFKREDRYYRYFENVDTPGLNEFVFLNFMGYINAGIGLVRANNSLNEFTELKLNSDGTDVIETPCNPS
jgi:uncharacterized membrane protein YgcG